MLLMCTEVDVNGKPTNQTFKLGLITDLEMFKMIEKAKRGGMCQVSMSHIVANNPYMGAGYDKYMKKVYIMYLDANNLYGVTMVQNLPYDCYLWNTQLVEQGVEQKL